MQRRSAHNSLSKSLHLQLCRQQPVSRHIRQIQTNKTSRRTLYSHAIKALDRLGLAYLHFIEPRASGTGRADVDWQNVPSAMVLYRPMWSGVLLTAGNFASASAQSAVADGHADAIAFGRYFISNPDLPRRLQYGYQLTPYNRATFYGGEEKGYTDYPAHDEMAPTIFCTSMAFFNPPMWIAPLPQ